MVCKLEKQTILDEKAKKTVAKVTKKKTTTKKTTIKK